MKTIAMPALPASATMFRALCERDSNYEGVFLFGVKTTGVFCRPTCASRRPRRENVEFFATAGAALQDGFRPCLRCRPMDGVARPPELVEQLRVAVEREPTGRLTDKELAALGIEPSTARRQFRRYYGMTFHAYHRARRMGLALRDVRAGQNLIDVQLDRGFESASGFREAFAKIFGAPPGTAGRRNCLFAERLDTPLGRMLALADETGLVLLEFVDRRGLEREILGLRQKLHCAVVPGTNAHLTAIRAQLAEYFAGQRREFSIPLKPLGTPFQMRVWEQLQKIPAGRTRSYSDIAAAVGRPKAVRAVGRANGQNHLAIVIPCHRVVRADGLLCGYAGGVWRKQALLDRECRHPV